jgi:hypothetical protein
MAKGNGALFKHYLVALLIISMFFSPLPLVRSQVVTTTAEDLARQEFEAIPDTQKIDLEVLDTFIQFDQDTYGGTEQGNIAFTLRFNLTRSSFDIGAYNQFVDLYGDTIAGRLAVTEVYELYQLRNEVPSYLDFMARYPNVSEAYLAKLKVHELLFNLAEAIYESDQFAYQTKLDVLYDFMFLNDGAPQIKAAEMLAKMLEVNHQMALRNRWLATKGANYARDDLCGEGSRLLLQPLRQVWRAFDAVTETTLLTDDLKRASYERARLEFALEMVYPECFEFVDIIRGEERYEVTKALLKQIDDSINTSNDELIAVIREEFDETRELLRQEFQSLREQIDEVTDRLDQLHNDLVVLNDNVITVQQTIENGTAQIVNEVRAQGLAITDAIVVTSQRTQELIGQQIQATNNLTEVVHNDLVAVHGSIVDMNRDMNEGFTAQIVAVNQLSETVQTGFEHVVEEQRATRLDFNAGLAGVRSDLQTGFGSVVERLDTQITNQAEYHYETLRTLDYNTSQLLDATDLQTQMLTSTITMGNEQIIYRLDDVNTSVQMVGADLGERITGFRDDFNAFASTNTTLTASLLQASWRNAETAGRARATDFNYPIQRLVATRSDQPYKLPSASDIPYYNSEYGFDFDVETEVRKNVASLCAAYNEPNSYDIPCDEIDRMILNGELDWGAIGREGGQYLCHELGDSNLDCDVVANLIEQGVVNGGLPSLDSAAHLVVDYTCQSTDLDKTLGVGCNDLGNAAMIGTCLTTGDCVGVGELMVDWGEDAAEIIAENIEPAGEAVEDVAQAAGDAVEDLGDALGDVVGDVGGWFGL